MKCRPPERTNATDLTDNELLLLDAMFQFSALIVTAQFYAEVYAFHMNTGYTHSLSDLEVDQTLHSLQLRQLVTAEADEDGFDHWRMTDAGFGLWELEREPLWDRYICELFEFDRGADENQGSIFPESGLAYPVSVICSPTYEVIEKYLATAIACGLWASPRSSDRVHHIQQDYSKDSPKIFPIMHCLYIPVRQEDNSVEVEGSYQWIDWKLYEQQRVWWRSIHELACLREKSEQSQY